MLLPCVPFLSTSAMSLLYECVNTVIAGENWHSPHLEGHCQAGVSGGDRRAPGLVSPSATPAGTEKESWLVGTGAGWEAVPGLCCQGGHASAWSSTAVGAGCLLLKLPGGPATLESPWV